MEVVNVPLSVNLEKPIKQALLADIGLPIKPLSSNGYGSDLGYIFESQRQELCLRKNIIMNLHQIADAPPLPCVKSLEFLPFSACHFFDIRLESAAFMYVVSFMI